MTPGRAILATLDGLCWMVGIAIATVLRFDFNVGDPYWQVVVIVAAAVALGQVVVGFAFSLYRGRYQFASFDEVFGVMLSWGLVTLGFGLTEFGLHILSVPLSAALVASAISLCLMLGFRFATRAAMNAAQRGRLEGRQRAIVVGAGDASSTLIRSMKADPNSPYLPVALLDDDPGKSRLRIDGVPVRGTTADLVEAARRSGAELAVVAVARADAAFLRRIVEVADQARLSVKVLPSVGELLEDDVGIADLRDVTDADLLGRKEIDIDVEAVAHLIHDRRVLITGAGGSIGSELALQIDRLGPSAMALVDRDETGLQSVEMRLRGHGLLTGEQPVLADIRDVERMSEVFETFKPDIVFHAAALKHLPLLEQFPAEAAKTNVMGTLNVLRAARDAGVDTFVNISTDKAANPTSVLGLSKRATERITAWFGQREPGTFVSVRFGNVLGSRGSVLPSFRAQIEAGGPVTVTHPDVTRYFMTIPEAVQLVLQAAAIGERGEVMILDMGDPVRIADVARQLVALSGRRVEIRFTGLRPGEKLHEDLFAASEESKPTTHPLVRKAFVPPVAPDAAVAALVGAADSEEVAPRIAMQRLVDDADRPVSEGAASANDGRHGLEDDQDVEHR